MLDFKKMGAIAGLLQNKDRLIEAGQRIRRGLDERPAEGEAGGGAVRAWVDGSLKITRVEMSPAVLAGTDEASRDQARPKKRMYRSSGTLQPSWRPWSWISWQRCKS